MQEEASSQSMQVALKAGKGKGTDSLLQPPEGRQATQHLDFMKLMKRILDF